MAELTQAEVWRVELLTYRIRILDSFRDFRSVEELQSLVWPGDGREIVPGHLKAAVEHGGVLLGAYPGAQISTLDENDILEPGNDFSPQKEEEDSETLVGFTFSFPGIYQTPDGPRLMHVSHMLAVHPQHRNQGIGFLLKRAQWQMVRRQGIDRVAWTYDPLLSRNGYLNIARLGGVSNTYQRDYYGEMRDSLNAGLPSDRFVVDWWINTRRVNHRLSNRPRLPLDLAHFPAGGVEIVNSCRFSEEGWPVPPNMSQLPEKYLGDEPPALALVEIPSDFQMMRSTKPGLCRDWRQHSRLLFETLFEKGYLVTDFIHLSALHEGGGERSYYVLSYGKSTL